MSKFVFFSIPAQGHVNPTIEIVRELTSRGHTVWYYSFDEFRERIEDAGGNFISCNDHVPKLTLEKIRDIGMDFTTLMEISIDITICLEDKICKELEEFEPDCIISDSVCIWGKLFANKLNIPYVCSTTTFAFNDYTIKMLKFGLNDIFNILTGMGRINKKIEQIRIRGYKVKSFLSLIRNDNDTNTIVYTSKKFQPMSETFSDKYYFIGPSIQKLNSALEGIRRKQIYISLGTVNNKNIDFYKNCIKAFEDTDVDVIMSVGKDTVIEDLGKLPDNFQVKNSVNQIKVLQNTDVFITHCGMNSVNESLLYSVPMVLFPQQLEQKMVAKRVVDLGAGLMLKKNNPNKIKDTVLKVMDENDYKKSAKRLSESFQEAGGAKKAVDSVLVMLT